MQIENYVVFSYYLQSLALLENELPVKLAVLNVLQQFSRNSGKNLGLVQNLMKLLANVTLKFLS